MKTLPSLEFYTNGNMQCVYTLGFHLLTYYLWDVFVFDQASCYINTPQFVVFSL